MPEAPLLLEKKGDIACLTMSNPPGNEMDRHFFDAFVELVETAIPSLRCSGLIITGRGRHFSSGAKIGELRALPGEENSSLWDRRLAAVSDSFRRLGSLPFPVIAAVRGCCFGSAMELALACTFRVADRRAVFALPESGFGLMPGCGGTVRLPPLVGLGRSIELILTGRTLSAEEALRIGAVDMVVDRKDLIATAERLLRGGSRHPPAPAAGTGGHQRRKDRDSHGTPEGGSRG